MRRTLAVLVVLAAVVAIALTARGVLLPRARAATLATSKPKPTEPSSIRAEARVVARPGASVTLSAELLATVARVAVHEGQHVKKGDVLLEYHRAEHVAALSAVYATATEAKARLRARSDDLRRSKQLVASGSLPEHDQAASKEEQNVAFARLSAAGAEAAKAKALLDKTRIVSPIDGVVVARQIEAEETTTPGMPLFVVADLEQLRLEAEIDEFDLGRIGVDHEVTITAEGFPDVSWRGAVEEIPSIIIPRRLRSQDPARITDAGVVLAKIAFLAETPLKLGQRVTVSVSPRAAEKAGELSVRWP